MTRNQLNKMAEELGVVLRSGHNGWEFHHESYEFNGEMFILGHISGITEDLCRIAAGHINRKDVNEIRKRIVVVSQAEMTNRCIPCDEDFQCPEWKEEGTLEGVPVMIMYRTSTGDMAKVKNSGDWGDADWDAALEDIFIDICECDRLGTDDDLIDAIEKKYSIEGR